MSLPIDAQRNDSLLRITPALGAMPTDVLNEIFKYVTESPKDVLALKLSCKRFNQILGGIEFNKTVVKSIFRKEKPQNERKLPVMLQVMGFDSYKPDLTIWDHEGEINDLTKETLPLFVKRIADTRKSISDSRTKNLCYPIISASCCLLLCAVLALGIWAVIYGVHHKK